MAGLANSPMGEGTKEASELARELARELERANRFSTSLKRRIATLEREAASLVEQHERVRQRRGELASRLQAALTAAGVDQREAAGIVERALSTEENG
jgi:hypothetical protein